MDKEELEKEAEDKGVAYTDSLKTDIKVEDGVEGYSWYQVEQAYEKGALDFAEPREKKIADLEEQIEKMKNCNNCGNYYTESCKGCENYCNWRLRR